MPPPDPKDDLRRYLQEGREALVWKLEGLSEYDIRRPLVPTGTNLLGLVKHSACVELGYFGATFGRPSDEPIEAAALSPDAEPNADMWATADESRDDIAAFYRRAWALADATIEALPLETVGRVPWWPDERSEVTLHHIMVRVIAENLRHAGQADIVRELIDGSAGMRSGNGNMPEESETWWRAYCDRLETVAKTAGEISAS